MDIGVIICSVISVIFLILSYLIWVKKKLFLIAGYNENTFVGDKRRLARIMGIFLLSISIITFTLPFAQKYIGSFAGDIFGFIVIAGSLAIVVYINIINRPS